MFEYLSMSIETVLSFDCQHGLDSLVRFAMRQSSISSQDLRKCLKRIFKHLIDSISTGNIIQLSTIRCFVILSLGIEIGSILNEKLNDF